MNDWLEQNSPKIMRLALVLTLFVSAIYFAIGSFFGPDGHPAPIIRDAYIFHQYARQLAEGHPYQFNTGESPTTACTSHLYPAILAVAYAVGARGWAILSAAFAINAIFLVASVALFGAVMRKLDPRATGLAVLIFALCGQVYITTLDQMDSALFLCLSLAMLAAVLYERWTTLVVLAFLAPWCRPEGMILSFFLLVTPWLRIWGNRKPRNMMALAGAIGLASYGGVLLLNYTLTGTTTFHSVIGKSPFGYAPAYHVLGDTIRTAAKMARELGLGLADSQRQFMLPPIGGALLLWIGLMSRNWKSPATARAEACWLATAVACLGLIAFSGWQGVQYDRYVTWMMPLAAAYMAMGIYRVSDAASRLHWRPWLIAGMLLWQAAGLGFLTTQYFGDCSRGGSNAAFLNSLSDKFPKGTTLGMNSGAGVKYIFPQYRIVNISGIETPEFAHHHPTTTNMEILKHDPKLRFDYWLLPAATSPNDWFGAAIGEQLLSEVPAIGARSTHSLYRADWKKFDDALGLRSEAAKQAVAGMTLVDSLDIGWIPDEESHDYEVFDRIAGSKIRPYLDIASCGDALVMEVSRVIIGSESFRVKATPGKNLRIVMRTRLTGQPVTHKVGDEPSPQEFNFSSPLGLILIVDDGEPIRAGLTISGDKTAFVEAILDIPGEKIRSENPRLTIGGDHISCSYWFYQ